MANNHISPKVETFATVIVTIVLVFAVAMAFSFGIRALINLLPVMVMP